mmetsp:Transcript_43937/g.105633  ORF Transcript_43937/g.105633 Transcript_43937/m.105633 type:complete len:214 (-) Transcript_43937:428-1069(-)
MYHILAAATNERELPFLMNRPATNLGLTVANLSSMKPCGEIPSATRRDSRRSEGLLFGPSVALVVVEGELEVRLYYFEFFAPVAAGGEAVRVVQTPARCRLGEAAGLERCVSLLLQLLLLVVVVDVERGAGCGRLADAVGSAVGGHEEGVAVPHVHRLVVGHGEDGGGVVEDLDLLDLEEVLGHRSVGPIGDGDAQLVDGDDTRVVHHRRRGQ